MEQYNEVVAMLTVIYKRLVKLELASKGKTLSASNQHYIDELRNEARKIMDQKP